MGFVVKLKASETKLESKSKDQLHCLLKGSMWLLENHLVDRELTHMRNGKCEFIEE